MKDGVNVLHVEIEIVVKISFIKDIISKSVATTGKSFDRMQEGTLVLIMNGTQASMGLSFSFTHGCVHAWVDAWISWRSKPCSCSKQL